MAGINSRVVLLPCHWLSSQQGSKPPFAPASDVAHGALALHPTWTGAVTAPRTMARTKPKTGQEGAPRRLTR